MNGEWVILIWVLVSVIFLMGNPAVRTFFLRLRKMSTFGVICTVLFLGYFAHVSYTKEPAPTNQTSQASQNYSLLPTPCSLSEAPSSLPDFWKDDTTDTDGDGIPDLWEKWTHGKKLVADSDLDRDGDGLTDLEEFWNQTDPRTADTDGDSFSDFFEIANGMNPISAEDFIPLEPDTNNNGVPDIWEQIGYSGSFCDANGNGFDDTYERNSLPAASDDNFDVLVDVYTTRSAAFYWTKGENRGTSLILPTTGTSVKIRLPFGVDTELNLESSPYGTDLPSGELWKSRMSISFAPRTGQNLQGNALVSSTGIIAHKIIGTESVIVRFPELLSGRGVQTQSSASGSSDGPNTDIKAGKFEVYCFDRHHGVDDVVGPITVTNLLGMGSATYGWSSRYGDMDPDSGSESWLTVTRLPTSQDEKMTVVTTAELDSQSWVDVTSIVEPCSQRMFSASFSTDNFSPHLGETLGIGVTLPGCIHHSDSGWLEIEFVRETMGKTEHVASVDMDGSTSTVDRYLNTSAEGGQSFSFTWDGIAQTSLSQGDYVEEFTQGNRPFHRAAPAVAAGQPVPPPYVTLLVRLWNPGKNVIIAEASRQIYVPQVVQVRWQSSAETLFRTPIDYKDFGQTNLVYSADYAGNSATLMQDTLQRLRAYYPASVNILFVPFFSADSETTKFLFITPEIRKVSVHDSGTELKVYAYGMTSPTMLQRSATGMSSCNLGSVYDSIFEQYKKFAESSKIPQPFPVPISSSQMLEAICRVSAHEVGHTLGLVDTTYLDGVGNKHNPGSEDQTKMMNINTDLKWLFNQHPPIGWRTLNSSYLEFVLPIPK